jgi:NAD(P)-dependent dehydrogenase (short-subunit alcohol dehydrogenase family)
MTTAGSRVALITGAGSGLGRQLTLDLLGRGWKVAGLDRDAEGLAELAEELGETGAFVWRAADVTQPARLGAAVATLEGLLGPVDLLVACAGIAGETPAVGLDPAAVAHIVGVNLIGVSNTIAAVLPGMLARRRGHVVAISSLASYRGLPAQMGYCASKAGLNALLESLRLDVKRHGIYVTTVCPGPTRTPQAVGMYKAGSLMPVEQAAREVLKAIDRRKRFHAFPWSVVSQLWLMGFLPAWSREWLLNWGVNRLKGDVGGVSRAPGVKRGAAVVG